MSGETAVRHVVMVTNAVAPDKLGGLERYVRELSAALVKRDWSVTVVSKRMDPAGPLQEIGSDGVAVVRHVVPDKADPLFALKYPVYVARGVRAALRHHPGAVVHGHYAIPTLAVPASAGYLYTFHAPVHKEVVSERQGSYRLPRAVEGLAVAAVRQTERFVVRRAVQVVTLSRFMQGEVALLSAGGTSQTAVIAGGIDTDRFCPGPAEGDDWAKLADPLIFTARRLTPRTGVLQLVEAMSAVRKRYPDARLAVAGSGSANVEISAAITARGLGQAVRLLGRVADDELLRWIRLADLCVTPTQDLEGFGLFTAEALAAGAPVLVTPAGANPELVTGLHRLLVADGTTAHLIAGGIIRLLEAPEVLRTVRHQARASVHPTMSWSDIAARYHILYDQHSREGHEVAGWTAARRTRLIRGKTAVMATNTSSETLPCVNR